MPLFQAEVVESSYDAKREKEEREKLMNHYEKLLKDKVAELSVEKRESVAIRSCLLHNSRCCLIFKAVGVLEPTEATHVLIFLAKFLTQCTTTVFGEVLVRSHPKSP